MFKDEHKRNVLDQVRQHGIRAFEDKLSAEVVQEAAQRAGVKLGEGTLWLGNLVWLGIACAIQTTCDFATVLQSTLRVLNDDEAFAKSEFTKAVGKERRRRAKRKQRKNHSKHDPYGSDPAKVSEEAFVQARHRMPIEFWLALLVLLGERFQKEHREQIYWNGFRLLAMDGTTISLENWTRLKKYYGTASNGRGGQRVQARMVMLQFPLARLPYHYEVTPLKEGEHTVAERMAKHIQTNDLVLLDRGFWSYALFCQLENKSAYFGIRLPKGPKLQTRRWLGKGDRLVRWAPSATVLSKWRRKGHHLPKQMELRVIDYQMKGFRPSAVVTNMLDAKRVTRQDWVRLTTDTEAGDNRLGVGLYHRRWEIETSFAELKVTQGMEGSLRSRTPEGIEYEIAGHVLLYFLVRWLIAEAAAKQGQDPLRLSFTAALHTLQEMRVQLITSSLRHVRSVLLPRLLERIATAFVPERPGRHYPRPRDGKVKNKGKGWKQQPAKLVAQT